MIVDVDYEILDNNIKKPKIKKYEKNNNQDVRENNQTKNISDLVTKLNKKISVYEKIIMN